MAAGSTSASPRPSWNSAPSPRDKSVSWGKEIFPSSPTPRGWFRMSRMWLTVNRVVHIGNSTSVFMHPTKQKVTTKEKRSHFNVDGKLSLLYPN